MCMDFMKTSDLIGNALVDILSALGHSFITVFVCQIRTSMKILISEKFTLLGLVPHSESYMHDIFTTPCSIM